MTDNEIPGIDKETTHITPSQEIVIPELPPGSILDIGGGGEGVIGQAGGSRITSIDLRETEIAEAKERGSKAKFMIADATNLPFTKDEFDHATSFFTGMYMSIDDITQCFREIYRVIKKGGEFWYWDSVIHNDKELFIIQIKYVLPNKITKQTGYGTRNLKNQSLTKIKQLLENTGFTVSIGSNEKYWYFLKAKKD